MARAVRRAFIHISNTVECLEIAAKNPPQRGEKVKIFNQMAETHNVRGLAELVSKLTGAGIIHVPNPRNESAENDLFVKNDHFLELGMKPVLLDEGLLEEVEQVAQKYAHRVDPHKIPARSLWNNDVPAARQGDV